MAGPYPPHGGADASGPIGAPPDAPNLAPPDAPNLAPPVGPGYDALPYPFDSETTGPLPRVDYHRRSRWRMLAIALGTVAAVAAIVTATAFAVRGGGTEDALDAASAQTAIQTYLDALADADLQVISRNVLCGLYDGVRDRRADDALAAMSSDAFQKQWVQAQVTSVDEIVLLSPNSAQVLFTMDITPSGPGGAPTQRQGVAQLLAHDGEVLVCSYVMRTLGMF